MRHGQMDTMKDRQSGTKGTAMRSPAREFKTGAERGWKPPMGMGVVGSIDRSGWERDHKTSFLCLQPRCTPSSWPSSLFDSVDCHQELLLGHSLHETRVSEARTMVRGEKIHP